MVPAMTAFVEETVGRAYTVPQPFNLTAATQV
jgi:hypothetical protein